MKISFFIGSMEHGGAEKVISLLSNAFVEAGHEVDIVLLLKNVINPQYGLSERITVTDLSPRGGGGYFKNSFFWLRSIRKYFKKRKPDIAISFVGRINCLVLLASIGLKTPIYISERNDPKRDGRGLFFTCLCNILYGRAKKIIFQTKYEMSCFPKRLYKKSVILPNPVKISGLSWNPKEDDVHTIVNTARLTKQKNHYMLLRAVKSLISDGLKVRCIIYGEGELRKELETFICDNGLSDFAFLPGNVPDACVKISTADLFVQTSYFEGLSNSLIEAMSLGMPCVCTNYPGASEIIHDGENGLLVNVDDVECLRKTIKRIIENPEISKTIGKHSKETAAYFSDSSVIAMWKKEVFGSDC